MLGLTGLLIVLLWFATEHTVTKSNWNLLWALPTHIWLGVTFLRDRTPSWLPAYLWMTLGLIALVAAGWASIPQEFNAWLIPYFGIVSVRSAMHIRRTRI